MCIRCAYYSTCKGAVHWTLIAYPTTQYICGLSGGGLALPDCIGRRVRPYDCAVFPRLRIERGWLAEFERNTLLLTVRKLYPVALINRCFQHDSSWFYTVIILTEFCMFCLFACPGVECLA